jgi:hypothetical protein
MEKYHAAPDGRETDPKLREEGGEGDFKQRVGGFLASTCHIVRYRTFNARLCYLFVQALKARFGVVPERALCNQTANLFMYLIAGVIEIPIENFVMSGPDTGHVGSADIVIVLDKLLKSTGCHEPYLMAASTPYAFGSGLLMPV